MSDLMGSLTSTAGALDAFSRVLETIQGNVANSETPGYARQTQTLDVLGHDGSVGGVRAGAVTSARDEFAEQRVRIETTTLGTAQQDVANLSSLQSVFDISAGAPITSGLSKLYQSFSAWGQTPSDPTARQNVLDNAASVASAFQSAATGLSQISQNTTQDLQNTVNQINGLSSQLQSFNQKILGGDRQDASLDAQVHNTLEQLSQYASVSTNRQSDGSYTVLLNGQTPLVVGNKQFNIQLQFSQPTVPPPTNLNAPAHAQLMDADGRDITSQVTAGQLGSLVKMRNVTLPAFAGDSYQAGSLNTMAQQFADRVNQVLTSGNISDGPPPQPGVALFTYDTANPTNAAQSFAVDPAITSDQLAAIQPGPPEVGNGIPLQLSQLATPLNAADQIGGGSYIQFYGKMAASVGTALNNADDQQTVQQASVAQAQSLRQQSSGVDLDQEAATLVEFQRAYEANSRLMTVLSQLTQDTINIIPNA